MGNGVEIVDDSFVEMKKDMRSGEFDVPNVPHDTKVIEVADDFEQGVGQFLEQPVKFDDPRGFVDDTFLSDGNKMEAEKEVSERAATEPLDLAVTADERLEDLVDGENVLLVTDEDAEKTEKVQDGASCSGSKYLKEFQKLQQELIENVDALNKSQAVDVIDLKNEEESVDEDKQRTIADEGKRIPFADEASAGESIVLNSLPAGLGKGVTLMKSGPRSIQQSLEKGVGASLMNPQPRATQQSRVNVAVSDGQALVVEETSDDENEEKDETQEKLQTIRVNFLRLAHRLGQTPRNLIVAQVLYRIGLVEQLRGCTGGRFGAFSFDRASVMAQQLEAAGQEPLDFSCTIMVIGKTGVGKSATINSIFDEAKFGTNAFELGTKRVQDVVGTVHGIKVRVIDTPGLLPSCFDQIRNEKTLLSVKRFIKKNPPDIVLYFDRLDVQSKDDMPLLRTITKILGPSIWFIAIAVLTHAASPPPDGPNGTPSSYDMFVTRRSHVVQQLIHQAAGYMRLMNPVVLVENHLACRVNRAGQRVLPNGQIWKPHLLLLSFASKILDEANTDVKVQDSPLAKPFISQSRAPSLLVPLSSLLQSRPQVRLPEDQFSDEDTLYDDLMELYVSDSESEYDELPPFKRLTKAKLNKLTKAQRNAYFDELEYRDKLLMKKQWKEYKRQQKIVKTMEALAKDSPSEFKENVKEDSHSAAKVFIPEPERALPDSFDSDDPSHRYHHLDSPSQWLVIPVAETQGWDHCCN